jgi:hypothetical protein
LIVLVGEEHVEAGQGAVAAGDVSLQLDLDTVIDGEVVAFDLW